MSEITPKELCSKLCYPIVMCNICRKKRMMGSMYSTYYNKVISVTICKECINENSFDIYL